MMIITNTSAVVVIVVCRRSAIRSWARLVTCLGTWRWRSHLYALSQDTVHCPQPTGLFTSLFTLLHIRAGCHMCFHLRLLARFFLPF